MMPSCFSEQLMQSYLSKFHIQPFVQLSPGQSAVSHVQGKLLSCPSVSTDNKACPLLFIHHLNGFSLWAPHTRYSLSANQRANHGYRCKVQMAYLHTTKYDKVLQLAIVIICCLNSDSRIGPEIGQNIHSNLKKVQKKI